jgi:hypothetical protein
MSCEDFPCCGHEPGCCPDYDESGRQLNMVCTCGAKLPVNSRYSICNSCMSDGDDDYDDRDDYEDDDYDDSMDGDWDSGMTSAGWGTDEDYGHYCDNDYFDDY